MNHADPFGTAALRRAVLQAWEASPTRFREDANAEEDLRLGGYRDRLLVELAQNAADAAGQDGVVRVELVGDELRVANTGQPLTADGVAGLASLRASAKRTEDTVGRFGVGFAAVLSVSDEPRIVSSSGGVAFSVRQTCEEVRRLPGPAAELDARGGDVPVLRLPWPTDEQPPAGFTTEVRLPLRGDGTELLDACAEQASDLLLALPALTEVRVGDQVWRREELGDERMAIHGPRGIDRWLVHRASGELTGAVLAGLRVESRHAMRWQACWAVPLSEDGIPIPLAQDVLHAPTPTEERLSMPARLLATLPMEPDRRRVAPATATEAVLVHAAETYPDLVVKVAPEHRAALVPLPGFPLSDVDEKLRQAVAVRLRVTAWLPAAAGGLVAAHEARVIDHVAPELTELLKDVVPGLLVPELSDPRHRRPLSALEVTRLDAAELVKAVSGLRRPASWWRQLYAALAPIEESDPMAREELSALPVPLADGRTVTGVRDVLLVDDESGPLVDLSTLDISGLRIADRDARHPLLERLGARRAGPSELLDSDSLVDAVLRSVDEARAGTDVFPLVETVLRLVREAGPRNWLGALALPDRTGELRRADELLMPDAALLAVLDPEQVGDGPLSVLDDAFAQRWPAELLRSAGVVDGFVVHHDEDPTGPEDDFPDTEQWWADREAAGDTPVRFVGIRDLDLVADDKWAEAIRLLSANPETLRGLREPGGYVAWWIARFATLAGQPPRHWRMPAARRLAGIYDPVPDLGLSTEQLQLAGVRSELDIADADDAADLLERLGNPERVVRAGTGLLAHRCLADAVACGTIDTSELEPPYMVRSISGAVVSSDRAVVLDEPWMLGVLEAPLVVAGGSPDEFDAEALAEILDLPLASDEGGLRVEGDGRRQTWADVARVSVACELLGMSVPDGEVVLHDELWVAAATGRQRVHWWVDTPGDVHAERTPDGLARALAWAAGSWSERFALTALLADPDAATLLR